MKNQIIVVSAVVLIASGCGYGVPYTNPGPAWSFQGLQVGIAGTSCSARQDRGPMVDANDKTQDFFDLELKLRNSSGQVEKLSEERLRLLDYTAPARYALTPENAQVVSVAPGETKDLRLRFSTKDGIDCQDAFELLLGGAIQASAPYPSLRAIGIGTPG
jgi:hypothetical protein